MSHVFGKKNKSLTNKRGLAQVATADELNIKVAFSLIHLVVLPLQRDPGPVQTEWLVGQSIATCKKAANHDQL